jgi:DNA-directed RNA polymerase subunit E'/Rpb7
MNYACQITLEKKIILKPEELDDIEGNIYKYLYRLKETTDVKNGYILDIVDIISYTNIVSPLTSNVIFNVEFVVSTLVPKPDDIYTNTIVTNIFKEGIFVIYNNIHILIPWDVLSDKWDFIDKFKNNGVSKYTLRETDRGDVEHDEGGSWGGDKQTTDIKVDDCLSVVINYVQYNDHQYQCIGSLSY